MVRIDKKDFPSDISAKVEMPLQVKQLDGNNINVIIAEVSENSVTLDANPPLAGETLLFDIEFVEFV